MPKSSLHTLAWSQVHQCYELSTQGHLRQSFRPDESQCWQDWLARHASFAFHGQQGQMSVVKEARLRGTGYWYAYSTYRRQTRKRYLGPTKRVTLHRLEHTAQSLAAETVALPQRKPQAGQHLPGSPAPSRPASAPLFATRVTPPRLPSTLVKRERLQSILDAIRERQVGLVCASAGSGPPLLSQWARQSPHPVARLSLAPSDNEPTRFWASVITTLVCRCPDLFQIGDFVLAMLSDAQPPPLSTILTTLIHDLAQCPHEMMLILDDYQVVEDPTIQEAMRFLLDHLPANLHLILSSRVDPALPFARFRMRGQLVEIREADVRFTREEADRFLRDGMQLSLSADEVALLADRTEGWIAGLQLAALSLRHQANPSAAIQNITGGAALYFRVFFCWSYHSLASPLVAPSRTTRQGDPSF